MSDTQSFDFRSTTVAELADQVQGCVAGDGSVQIRGAACIEEAESGDIVFAESPRFLFKATRSKASAVVAFLDAVSPDKPLIKVDNPRFAFARILELFSPMIAPPIGVHPSAVVGEGAEISATASVGANVVIGERATIGDRSVVMGGCVLGDDVSVGEDCLLHANVSLYAGTRLGDRVILHSGVVVGSDGFGYVRMGARSHKVPHVGIVEIGDDVEVGANTTIDRAKTGSTIIGARTKIDNLVQIAHNVKMGEDCVVAALVGIAGSAVIGNAVTIAGQAGVRDHVSVGDGALVLGRAGVWGDTLSGAVVSGNPARSHRERLKIQAAESDLPRMARRLKELEAINTGLEERTKRLESALDELLGRPSG